MHLEKTVNHVLGFRVVVIVLSQSQLPVGGKEEQTFYCLNLLDCEMIELASQLPKQQRAGSSPGEDQ